MTDYTTDFTKGLNREQAQAVLHDKGPLLILAGAGSGKTRVITHRIAHLVRNLGVRPYRILAITFTNKAAKEMKSRIESLIGGEVESIWVGTFHSMLARILRKHAYLIGFDQRFIILDSDDQQKIIKNCVSELNLDEKKYPPKMVSAIISKAKNELVGPEEFAKESYKEFRKQEVGKIYSLYQKKLKDSQAMDFDDILYFSADLLRNNPDVLDYYRDKFEYILVDEYQDTNHAQYAIVEMLAQKHRNLCVVGDDDQSIYSFRGANIRNILDFEDDFKGCRVIKLEQNYRSTKNVLNAANSVIANNKGRKVKKLWTDAEDGELITVLRAEDQISEARYVADEINRLTKVSKQCKYSDIAILYRLNALSRNFETELMRAKIPYKVLGGMRFFDRKEIKDIMAYLRLILIGDNLSFLRIINVPRRGIGEATLEAMNAAAGRLGVTFLQACGDALLIPELSKSCQKFKAFGDLIFRMKATLEAGEMSMAEYIEYVQNESGIMQEIIELQERKDETTDRVENLKELLSSVIEFDTQYETLREWQQLRQESDLLLYEDEDHVPPTLAGRLGGYLESVALYAETEDQAEESDYVKLMTIHSAKGLEFDHVFIVGVEEGLFPGMRTITEGGLEGLEEERRLAYVSITRARKRLVVTTAKNRMLFGQTSCNAVSRFIKEIPDEYVNEIAQNRLDNTRKYTDNGGMTPKSTVSKGFGSRLGDIDRQGDIISTLSKKAIQPAGLHTTGAADSSVLKPGDAKVGNIVSHVKFGNGYIKTLLPVADDAIVEIEFKDYGVKKMMLKQAKLIKLD